MTRVEALRILAFAKRFYRYGSLCSDEIKAAWLFLNPEYAITKATGGGS